MIEETSLNVKIEGYLRPFPGHFYREVVEGQIGKKRFAQEYNGKPATTTSVFAFTEDGITAHIFTGSVEGTIRYNETSWVECDGKGILTFPFHHLKSIMNRMGSFFLS